MDRTDVSPAPRLQHRPGYGLPAELYLLACDLRKTRVSKRHEVLGNAMRAAVLIELTERGCLTDEDGKARPVGDRLTGVPLLDESLRVIGEEKPRTWRMLVEQKRKWTLESVEEVLLREGVVTIERRKVLPNKVEVLDRGLVKQLHAEAAGTLNGDVPVEEVEPRRAALAALAAVSQLQTFTTGMDRFLRRKRIRELTKRAGDAGPAMKKLAESRQIMTLAVIGGISAAGS